MIGRWRYGEHVPGDWSTAKLLVQRASRGGYLTVKFHVIGDSSCENLARAGLQQEGFHLAEACRSFRDQPRTTSRPNHQGSPDRRDPGGPPWGRRPPHLPVGSHLWHAPPPPPARRNNTTHVDAQGLWGVAMVKNQWLWLVNNFGFFVHLFDKNYATGWICACICFGLLLAVFHF